MLTRRDFLAAGTAAAALATYPSRALAQAPKRGGTLAIRAWDPPHFDAILAHAYKTHVVISFTHSRLLRHRAGAGGPARRRSRSRATWPSPGRSRATRPTSSSCGAGVRFHAKPPVNGRELTADDVKYTFERILTDKGSANASMYRADREGRGGRPLHGAVHAQGALRLVPRHGRQPHGGRHRGPGVRGEVRRPQEAGGGDRHRPVDARELPPERRRSPWCAIPRYFVRRPAVHRPGRDAGRRGQRLAHGRVPRPASTISAGSSRARSTARTGCRSRTGSARRGRPCADRRVPVERRERPRDAHGSEAVERRAGAPGGLDGHRPAASIIDATLEGVGVVNGPCPPRSRDWALPIDQLGEGARYYRHDPAEAKRLLAAAGYPERLPGQRLLHHLRLDRAGGHHAARAQAPEGRRHRRASSTRRSTAPTRRAAGSASSTRWCSAR